MAFASLSGLNFTLLPIFKRHPFQMLFFNLLFNKVKVLKLMKSISNLRPVSLSVLAALTFASGNVAAQDSRAALEEVVVTATKREQTLQDVPVAVTVTPIETIQRASIKDLADLDSLVTSLRVSTAQTSTQTTFEIRGFGNGANNPGVEPSVGVFIDGVYRSRSASAIGDLVDVERVEVLRGPQSTLFGQNASAGVISIVTQKPSFTLGGNVEATTGNFGQKIFKGKVTGPMSETVAFSLVGGINKRDGYFKELTTGTLLNDRNRWDVRGQILWNASDALTVRVTADKSKINELCCGVFNLLNGPTSGAISSVGGKVYTGSPTDRSAYFDTLPTNNVDNSGVSAHIDWKSDAYTLTSITSSRQQKASFNYDTDFTSASLVPKNQNDQRIDTITQELRLAFDNGGKVRGLIGAYYSHETVKYDNVIAYGPGFRGYATGLIYGLTGSPTVLTDLEKSIGAPAGTFFANGQGNGVFYNQKNNAYTLFSQVDLDLADRLTLTAGLAYTDTKKDVGMTQTNSDVFSQLDLVQIGFGSIFNSLTKLAPTPTNFALVPTAAAAADRLSVVPCSAATGSACNPLLGLYALQFSPPVVPFNEKSNDDKLTYTARLAYEFSDNLNGYAGVSSGFKATSWNLSRDSRPVYPATSDRSPLGGAANPYYKRYGTRFAGPESSTVVEVGLKGRWSQFAMNLAVFNQSIKDFQENLFLGTGFVLSNAGKQTTKGVEIETQYQFNKNWRADFAATLLDPKYDSYKGAPSVCSGTTDRSGTTPDGIHKTSVSPALTYLWQGESVEGYLRMDYDYQSKTLIRQLKRSTTNCALPVPSPSYDVYRQGHSLNMSAGFLRDGYEFQFWGRNLNNSFFITTVFPSPAQDSSVSGYPNMPRSYGVTVRKNF